MTLRTYSDGIDRYLEVETPNGRRFRASLFDLGLLTFVTLLFGLAACLIPLAAAWAGIPVWAAYAAGTLGWVGATWANKDKVYGDNRVMIDAVYGRVTHVEQSTFSPEIAEATIEIGRWFNRPDGLSLEGTLTLRGAPVTSGAAFGVRYAPDAAAVVYLNGPVQVTLASVVRANGKERGE